MRSYGARVVLVEGNYDDAMRVCSAACRELGWYGRSTASNPFTREGKKTVALELGFQLPAPPDWAIVPSGDGNILSAVYKGFDELRALGHCARMPRLVAAQARGSASVAEAFDRVLRGEPFSLRESSGRTRADSIAVGIPADGFWAVHALVASRGCAVMVDDHEILAASARAARSWGVFAEPAAACGLAAYFQLRARGVIAAGERVVCLITGSGLKDPEAALAGVEPATTLSRDAASSASFSFLRRLEAP
jgi:threonine synthase